jgi:UDP-N-acetyl-alpha-D-muramoyl-L-alanyl-L-glutamate epimerase
MGTGHGKIARMLREAGVTQTFRYLGFELRPERGLLSCRYGLGGYRFEESVTFPAGGHWDSQDVLEAARLVFLLAGVSYYKTAASSVIDLGQTPVTDRERAFLRSFYLDGLAEYAYRNNVDLSGLKIEGPTRPAAQEALGAAGLGNGEPSHPLVPFGGGIDSIVTVELVRRHCPALFIVTRPGDRFEAIERPAAVTGLPVVRAERLVDAQLQHDARQPVPSFLNGHVPITGILSAIAVMAAALEGRDAVVMSNEWSASIPTLEVSGRPINHQYSKSMTFESGFRDVLADNFGRRMMYFSNLRPYSELWVAQRFAALTAYHDSFHSCNKAFYLDPAKRLDYWCGECDKCCFIDLILAPFLPGADLQRIFGGREPLSKNHQDPAIADRFRTLLGTSPNSKPFECVGEVSECRAAVLMAAQRADRAGTALLQKLAGELRNLPDIPDPAPLLRPIGEHNIPDLYAAEDLLV